MAAAGVVAFEFEIEARGRVQCFFQIIGADQRRWAENFVKIKDFIRNVDIPVHGVNFLQAEFSAEDRQQVFEDDRLHGARIDIGVMLLFHVGADIVPLAGHLVFTEVDAIRNLVHGGFSFQDTWLNQPCSSVLMRKRVVLSHVRPVSSLPMIRCVRDRRISRPDRGN